MRISTTNYWLTINRNNEVKTNIFGEYEVVYGEKADDCTILYRICNRRSTSDEEKLKALNSLLLKYGITTNDAIRLNSKISKINDEALVTETIEKVLNFFSEFEFEPNFRFINTMAYVCQESNPQKAVKNYINNYFELTDSVYAKQIQDKLESWEFENIASDFASMNPSHKVNTRFKLYYGSQGTGKTTKAMEESEGRCMVCHSAMLPSDLMEDFKFENGQPNFTPSALQIAMTEGQTIVLDEINLLPFESLRFLQSILDGKKEFSYKGKTIHIHENFQVIGTMNLHVNGATYALPEPLVDRASELRKFKLTAENLKGAII